MTEMTGVLVREVPIPEELTTMFPCEFRGHCLTGPIAVRGAEPGTCLMRYRV